MIKQRVFSCFDPYMLTEVVNWKVKLKNEAECDDECEYLRWQTDDVACSYDHECLLFRVPELKTDKDYGFTNKIFICAECKKNVKIISSEVIGDK